MLYKLIAMQGIAAVNTTASVSKAVQFSMSKTVALRKVTLPKSISGKQYP